MSKIIILARQTVSFLRKLRYSLNPRIKFGMNVYVGPRVKINTVSGGNITIGDNCEISDSAKLFVKGGVITIGDNCVISDYVQMAAMDANIYIGNNSYINSFCYMSTRGGLTIGSDVSIAPQTIIVTDNHIFADKKVPINSQGYEKGKVVIEDDVWIGAGCKILSGVKIGKGAVVGAGAVVTKDLYPFGVYAGVPAKLLRER